MDFSQIQLIYRAEGNANLVLYLPQLKKILRLPKYTILPHHPSATGSLKSNGKNILDSEDHVAYITLIEQLLGTEYITRPEIVIISSDERDKLNRFCAPLRPAERLDKEFSGQFGLLFPDATYLPNNIDTANIELISRDTFAVEIKPKQGWMLQNVLLSCGNLLDLKGSSRCRYCSMQYSKLKCHKITKLSTYCPMDLFSGNIERMTKALDNLFQCPQNNLRLFKNGLLYNNGQSDFSSFDQSNNQYFNGQFVLLKKLLIKCLLKNYNTKKMNENIEIRNNLPNGCVLEKLLSLQLLSKRNFQFMTNHKKDNIKRTYNYLKILLNKINNINNIDNLTEFEQYMIGATAMDSSILIAFREIKNNEIFKSDNKNIQNHIVNIENRIFLTKITIVDIDPKPDNHFNKFIEKSNQAYLDVNSKENFM